MQLRYLLHLIGRTVLAVLAGLTAVGAAVGSVMLWKHRSHGTGHHLPPAWGFLCLAGGIAAASLLAGLSLAIGLLLDIRACQLGEPEAVPRHLSLRRRVAALHDL